MHRGAAARERARLSFVSRLSRGHSRYHGARAYSTSEETRPNRQELELPSPIKDRAADRAGFAFEAMSGVGCGVRRTGHRCRLPRVSTQPQASERRGRVER